MTGTHHTEWEALDRFGRRTRESVEADLERGRAVAARLEEGRPSEALRIADAIEDDAWRSQTLAEIAECLPDAGEALQVVRQIRDAFERATALVAISPRLPEAQRGEAIQEALYAARSIADQQTRARALLILSTYSAGGLGHAARDEALALIDPLPPEYVLPSLDSVLARIRPAEPTPDEFLTRLQAPEPAGEPFHLPYHMAGSSTRTRRFPIPFGNRKAVSGWLAPREKRIYVDHIKEEAGTLLYVGFAADRGVRGRRHWPTPFVRTLFPVLSAPAPVRLDGLIGLAAGLLPSAMRADLLAEAARSARALADRDRGREALARIAPLLPASMCAEMLEEARRSEPLEVPAGSVPAPSPAPSSSSGSSC